MPPNLVLSHITAHLVLSTWLESKVCLRKLLSLKTFNEQENVMKYRLLSLSFLTKCSIFSFGIWVLVRHSSLSSSYKQPIFPCSFQSKMYRNNKYILLSTHNKVGLPVSHGVFVFKLAMKCHSFVVSLYTSQLSEILFLFTPPAMKILPHAAAPHALCLGSRMSAIFSHVFVLRLYLSASFSVSYRFSAYPPRKYMKLSWATMQIPTREPRSSTVISSHVFDSGLYFIINVLCFFPQDGFLLLALSDRHSEHVSWSSETKAHNSLSFLTKNWCNLLRSINGNDVQQL